MLFILIKLAKNKTKQLHKETSQKIISCIIRKFVNGELVIYRFTFLPSHKLKNT